MRIQKTRLLTQISLIIGSMLTLFSCEPNYYSNPLPIDAKNIYEFPVIFRGEYKNDSEAYLIDKKSIKSAKHNSIKVIKGIYVNPADTIPYQNDSTAWKKKFKAEKPFQSTHSIRFDSLHHPIDTVMNYLVKEKRIYRVDHDGTLDQGYEYTSIGDTLYYKTRDFEIKLGTFAFLRKVSNTVYALNLREQTDWDQYLSTWWTIIILEKIPSGEILSRGLNKEAQKASIYHANNHVYFDVQWTKKDLLNSIKNGESEEFKPVEKHIK